MIFIKIFFIVGLVLLGTFILFLAVGLIDLFLTTPRDEIARMIIRPYRQHLSYDPKTDTLHIEK